MAGTIMRTAEYLSPEEARGQDVAVPGSVDPYASHRASGTSGKWLIAQGGANWPRWSRDGRRLFYATLDNYVMV